MKKYLIVALLASLLAGCAHDSPCVPVYDSQGRLVHTNTCMKGTTEDNWYIPCICSTPFPKVSDHSGSS